MAPPLPHGVKKIISPFSPDQLDAYAPWCILTTKVLAEALGTGPIALAMRIYRGVGPRAVPQAWLKGHVAGFLIADVRTWTGDIRSETEMFRGALPASMVDEPEEMIRLYARAEAETGKPLIGGTFTKAGREAYLNYLYAVG